MPHQQSEITAFGFSVGEERRYVLGPPETLRGAEAAEWRITLVRIVPEPANWRAVFELSYERQERINKLFVTRNVEALIEVNDSGFPLRIEFAEKTGGDMVVGEYTFENGTYSRHVRFRSWESNEPLRHLPNSCSDLSAPSGAIAFSAFRNAYGRNDYAKTIWSNPGLLGLALPSALPKGDWEREMLFVSLVPGTRLDYQLGRSARNRSVCGRIKLGVPEQIEIGGRTVDARRFEVQGPFTGAWVDPQGVVLLLEYEPHDMSRPHHVRLLWPSEY